MLAAADLVDELPEFGENTAAGICSTSGTTGGPKGEVSADDLIAHLAARFPRFRLPDRVVFVAQIPKTSVGKFAKKRIRAELAAGLLVPAGDRA